MKKALIISFCCIFEINSSDLEPGVITIHSSKVDSLSKNFIVFSISVPLKNLVFLKNDLK